MTIDNRPLLLMLLEQNKNFSADEAKEEFVNQTLISSTILSLIFTPYIMISRVHER
jgi:hypothetical protein